MPPTPRSSWTIVSAPEFTEGGDEGLFDGARVRRVCENGDLIPAAETGIALRQHHVSSPGDQGDDGAFREIEIACGFLMRRRLPALESDHDVFVWYWFAVRESKEA